MNDKNDVTPVAMKEQITKSGLALTSAKAKELLATFEDYFDIAAEWEEKVKNIIVTDETQTREMAMAREARLFLREKRLAIEKTRKRLKQDALNEGRAIDGIANILKAVIMPLEDYCMEQEKFVQIRDAKIAEEKRIQEEKEAERLRLEQAEAERKEQERIRIENEKLKEQARQQEENLRQEQEERRRQERLRLKEKADTQRKIDEEKRKREEAEKEKKRLEEKVEEQSTELEEFTCAPQFVVDATCPKCGHEFQATIPEDHN